jgi:hypothetical protein
MIYIQHPLPIRTVLQNPLLRVFVGEHIPRIDREDKTPQDLTCRKAVV